jgi:hypothetical protein
MRRVALPGVLFALLSTVAFTAQGCGDDGSGSAFDHGNGSGTGDDGSGGGPSFTGDDGGGGSTQCVNLQCQQVKCPQQGITTTISGTVYDPAGVDPLYNAIVYVPNATPDPFKDGASCDKCGAVASGSPVVTTITDAAGHFTLSDVPVGSNIPLVIQLGKWRRQVTIPAVTACVDNPIADKNLERLPRNKSEGDIPLMAIATGGADPFECLLLKIGIDPAEFTQPTGNGRIRYFVATGGAQMNPHAPNATSLWSTATELVKYDIVLLPCEGNEYLGEKPPSSAQAVVDYSNAGGRVFTTHYGYAWLAGQCSGGPCGAQPFPTTGQWNVNRFDMASPTTGEIDQSFPKGQAFADWLQNVGATTTKGQLPITESRDDLDKENNPPSQRWITAKTTGNKDVVLHITFNTPIGVPDDQQCGRVVFSDFHVSAAERNQNATFPASCKSGPLTAQEKALEFMLFDLSSCVQKDTKPPQPPPVVK